MRKFILLALAPMAIVFFTSQQSPGTSVQEVRVSTARNTTPVNGFRSNAANYEIVNLPQDGRTNVIKINGKDCNWNVIGYSLAAHRGKTITIRFSADIMRTGAGGTLLWQYNNEPDYPQVAQVDNAVPGVWYSISRTLTITPANREPFLYLTTWENNAVNTTYYFDNLNITITELTWDYTPATTLATVGETGSNNTRNLYVSAGNGSDSGNGTQARPFQKIAHAMHYVKPGDTVLVDSSTYHERFRIPAGAAGRPVTLTAMPGSEVIITPTIPIAPQWRQLGTRGVDRNIWVADISEYVKDMEIDFPQLFANRDSMVEARYPNMGPSMSSIMDYKRDVAQRGTNKNTVVTSRNIPADIIGARVIIWTGQEGLAGWGAFESPVRSVNGRTITLEKELTSYYDKDDGDPGLPCPGNPFYITGALALLDAPGEYYFDKKTNLLYFYPPWNGRPDQHTLTMRYFNNIAIQANNTSHVNIKNITIYGGGISMQNARNNTIENCRINYADHFYDSGWYKAKSATISESAMVITGNNNRISRNEFGPTAGHGIVLEGDDNVFTNNIVHTVGYSGNFLVGVCIYNSKRLEISHNTFIDASRDHVHFSDLVYERCIVRNNYFENHCILGSDSGAIFTLTAGTDFGGTEIYNNFIVSGDKGDFGTMQKLRFGLYTDNYNSNMIVRNNIVIGGHTGLVINLPNPGTQFYNNTVVGARHGFGSYSKPVDNADASNVTVKDNLFVNIRQDISYWGTENGSQASYSSNFINGTIPVTQRPEGRMTSSGNARGTVDAQYRPTGRTPDIGAIPRGGAMFPYGADWKVGERYY
ncbi:MAG: right-handed parallel beta-helix repeat-containing protein [Treponema sp.]|jgi:hypothetical protein|nr:right-handed parallel beta-helix repeat-containing protein [Treponema sp.]